MKQLLVIAVLMLATTLAFALEGDPIPGASVKIGRKPPGGPHSIAQGTTNAQGSFTFKDVPDGTFFVTFEVGGKSYEVFENETGVPIRVSPAVTPLPAGSSAGRESRIAATPVVTTRTIGDVTVTIEVLGTTITARIAKQKNAAQTTRR
jgi:hypothetical protein